MSTHGKLAAHKLPILADVLQPPHPSLKDDVPEGWSMPAISSWLSTFDEAIQESALKTLFVFSILEKSKWTQEQLREAGTRYGLPLNKLNKCPLKTLQNLVSVGPPLPAD